MSIFHHPIPPVFLGSNAHQPYAPNLFPEFLNNNVPPFANNRAIANATVIQLWQPDPWIYAPPGGFAPYVGRKLSASLLAVPVSNPPFTYGGPIIAQAVAVALAQPDPWQYSDEPGPAGGLQPYGQRLLNPTIATASNPPVTSGGPTLAQTIAVQLNQNEWDKPDPASYRFIGDYEPYGPRTYIDSILGVPVNFPPPDSRAAQQKAELAALWQPDPWVYAYAGSPFGTQPYAPKQNSSGINGQSADPPPFRNRTNDPAIASAIIAMAQPDPWVYLFSGQNQPYALRWVNPGWPGVSRDLPQFGAGRSVALNAVIAASQPDPWVYLFQHGAAGPYLGPRLSPAPPVGQPAPTSRYAQENYLLGVMAWQPDPWTYNFLGGLGPFVPRPLSPIVEAVPPLVPGAGKKPLVTGVYPDAPWSKKSGKPFKPVWDIGGEVEKPAAPPVIAPPAIPLPPDSIFGAKPTRTIPINAANPLNLPTFDHLVPPDPVGLGHRVQEAQDLSDAIMVLRALGLIK
jgi:hypothetical protein